MTKVQYKAMKLKCKKFSEVEEDAALLYNTTNY